MSLDYSVFASPSFDPNDYANAVLAGDPYPPPSDVAVGKTTKLNPPEASTKEEISLAISKLSTGIDDVAKQIKTLVTARHEGLLAQAASANQLSGSLHSVRTGLTDLDSSVEKLRLKIRVPYELMQTKVSRLEKLQHASDLLRRTSRFIVLARRLLSQMAEMDSLGPATSDTNAPKPSENATLLNVNEDIEDEKERTIAKAALSIAELVALLGDPKDTLNNAENGTTDTVDSAQVLSDVNRNSESKLLLRSVNAVNAFIPFIEESRTKVTSEMENMVLTGLATLNQSILASSLQTAYNLRVLPQLVQSLISDLSQAVEDRIRTAFDMNKISRDVLGKDAASSPSQTQSPTLYRSRVRTEPTNVTAPQWTAALWTRLEKMIEDMADCCVKVYTLEKVLKLKKDTVSQIVFLDEAMKLLENTPSATFWTALSRSLEKTTRDSAKASTFLQQALSSGYPRLLRLFHEFFAKVAVYTDTVYIHTYQSPETILVLRALSNFETLYLARSTNRLIEAVGQAFAGTTRGSPPGATEAVNLTRTLANELDAARFDPLLLRSVAKNVASSLDTVLSRIEGSVIKDRYATILVGPSATPSQVVNASLSSFLYHCYSRISRLFDEHSEEVSRVLIPSAEKLKAAYNEIVDPLLNAIRRDLGNIIDRIHRTDFGTSDPTAGMGGASLYMKDLVDKLSFIRSEILAKFAVGDDTETWVVSIVKFVLKTFVRHVSITKPLSESGKLQMTSDMTELEFALSAFMVDPQSKRGESLDSIGEEYHTLRAMRHLLFLDNANLASPSHTSGLPALIILNHILVRSPLPLPHTYHGWQDAEYVKYVDEHSEQQMFSLVESALDRWEKINASEGVSSEDGEESNFFWRKRLIRAAAMASFVLRARAAPKLIPARLLSTSAVTRQSEPPKPPKPIDDSTSALDYKRLQRTRPPPLPAMDLPRNRTAEEAVTNILYNTPPPSLQPFKKHILNCLVQNEPGVLSRVSGILAGRGFNIDSLVVCRTEIRDLSRMCIVLSGQDGVVEQARRQLEDLVPVWAVLDYTDTRTITRELLLVKVSILGPEYLEEQLVGGPSHEPRRLSSEEKLEREAILAQNFERSAHPEQSTADADLHTPSGATLTPSQALRLKHQHLHSINTLASQFGAKIVDVSENSVIVELTAKTSRVEAFLSLVKPFGILEAARTGLMAMPRTPISGSAEDELVENLTGSVDASLLPPG
uniref:Conserved oligomeric Golgi complex subunit 5 n=2 Tax=Moniliophthora roreri TaxID=221103 RepID=A0A0W0EYP2_MONRR